MIKSIGKCTGLAVLQLMLSLHFCVPGIAQTPDLKKVPDILSERCTSKPVGHLLDSKDVPVLLDYFGFIPNEVYLNCKTLRTDWLNSGIILSLSGFASSGATDSNRDLTLVQLKSEPRLWVIPISYGMIEVPNLIEDPHNLAAFNSLIDENHVVPNSPEMWTSLALLYMNMVGNRTRIADWVDIGESVSGLLSREPLLKREKLLPFVECKKDECEVTINDLSYIEATQVFQAWVLTFSTAGGKVKLKYVEREQKEFGKTQ